MKSLKFTFFVFFIASGLSMPLLAQTTGDLSSIEFCKAACQGEDVSDRIKDCQNSCVGTKLCIAEKRVELLVEDAQDDYDYPYISAMASEIRSHLKLPSANPRYLDPLNAFVHDQIAALLANQKFCSEPSLGDWSRLELYLENQYLVSDFLAKK